jgi:hypothetical protein
MPTRTGLPQACSEIASYNSVQSQPMTPGRKAAETRRRGADHEAGIKPAPPHPVGSAGIVRGFLL